VRTPSTINRRGGGPLPEKNDWSHPHDALQHALSGIDAEMRRMRSFPVDRGPRTTAVSTDPTKDF